MRFASPQGRDQSVTKPPSCAPAVGASVERCRRPPHVIACGTFGTLRNWGARLHGVLVVPHAEPGPRQGSGVSAFLSLEVRP